jgi:lipopolysaccharide/colanic/teichoic acid biosynthesis glycosyltransferase
MASAELTLDEFPEDRELMERCSATSQPHISSYFTWKWRLDVLAAAVLLIPGLPAIVILVVLVRLTSRGPGIFRQRRVGRDGNVFTMYKLRTMTEDAEEKTGAVWTVRNDQRITPLGYWLRKLHLDELPQLINVLRGEMSLVGPRPERPEFVDVLEKEIPGYLKRLAVLPGVTGLAQINLPPDDGLDSVRRKQHLDLLYIESADLWLDLRMMACTSLRLFGIRGETATRWMRLERTADLPPAVDHPQAERPSDRAYTGPADLLQPDPIAPSVSAPPPLDDTQTIALGVHDTQVDEEGQLGQQVQLAVKAQRAQGDHDGDGRSGDRRIGKELRQTHPK